MSVLRLPVGVTWIEIGVPENDRPHERRTAEHRAGRSAAAAGLAALGRPGPTFDAAPAGRGAPSFPAGFAGSITHDGGRAAALVATEASGYTAVGADLHVIRPMDEATARYIAGPVERAAARLALGPDADQVLFALKEATFKAQFSSTGTWCEFDDIEIGIDDHGHVQVLRPDPAQTELRWSRTGDIIRAAALIPAAP